MRELTPVPAEWLGRPLAETRWVLEATRLLADPVAYGRGVPRGDGRPVVVVPGFWSAIPCASSAVRGSSSPASSCTADVIPDCWTATATSSPIVLAPLWCDHNGEPQILAAMPWPAPDRRA